MLRGAEHPFGRYYQASTVLVHGIFLAKSFYNDFENTGPDLEASFFIFKFPAVMEEHI